MEKCKTQIAVGIFITIGFASFAFMAVKLGTVSFMRSDHYRVSARFDSVSGLKPGAHVEAAGVRVGEVESIKIDTETFEAVVRMAIRPSLKVPADSIASIRTSGIIGDKFIKLTPGIEEDMLEEGAEIFDTESSVSLEELVSKYIFESDKK